MKKLIWLACFSLVACSSVDTLKTEPIASNEPKAIVEKRALARWGALIRSDVDSAYKYLSPATRNTMSLGAYQGKIKPGLWRHAKVESATCEADICKVKVTVQYDLRDIKGLEMQVEETWLKDKDDWWYVWKG